MAEGGAPDALARALDAFVRAEILSPVAGLREFVDGLAREAAAGGLAAYADDLARMQDASGRLSALVASLLDGGAGAPASPASLRHDLRTPLTAILGYAELVAEEARDGGDEPLLAPLEDILAVARGLLREIDRLVSRLEPAPGGSSGAAGTAAEPILPEALRKAAAVARQVTTRSSSLVRGATGRILLVDDNAPIRDLVSRRLVREGHAVTACGDGHTALALAARGGFDLVLLDLVMPGLSGLEVLDRLRAGPEGATSGLMLPVIVISALDEVEAAVRCIEAGADDYLSKPLDEVLLRARITSSLERKFLRDREQEALRELRREQERSEALLRNVLPAGVVERLGRGETAIADQFDEVTVLFCDLVGFTALSSELSPGPTLDLLNEVFSRFDALAEENGLEKIKTIGDAYMVVGGLDADPRGADPRGDEMARADHARRVVGMACRMPAAAASVAAPRPLAVRVGVDTGPVAAGIIGRRKFFYDVWGDTVNTASRLEALAEPGRVHISSATRRALGDAFACVPRRALPVKGKGTMRTFYVEHPAGRPEDAATA